MASYRYTSFKFERANIAKVDADAKAGLTRFLAAREAEINTISTRSFVCTDGPFEGMTVEQDTQAGGFLPLDFKGWVGSYIGDKWQGTTGEPLSKIDKSESAKSKDFELGRGFEQLGDLFAQMSEDPEESSVTVLCRAQITMTHNGQDDFGFELASPVRVGIWHTEQHYMSTLKKGRGRARDVYKYISTPHNQTLTSSAFMDDFGTLHNAPGLAVANSITIPAQKQVITYTIGRTAYTIAATAQAIDQLRSKILAKKRWFADKLLSKKTLSVTDKAAQDVAQVVASAQAMAAIEQASESSALQQLASNTTDTSTEQAASQADDVQELAIVGEQVQHASQQAPGAQGGNMGNTSTTNTSSARQVASSTRAQAINSKSGTWNASFFNDAEGRPCLIFRDKVSSFDSICFTSGAARMKQLQIMARQADAAASAGARVCAPPAASQAPEQSAPVLKSETPQDQAQALKDADPDKLTSQQLRSIGSALMSEVDADSLSMATVQRWTPAMFAGAVAYLEDINYHSETLFLECMRSGRDDLAAVIAHLVRYQRAPEYKGLTGDYCEARQVVAMTLNGQTIERVSPEAAALLVGWGFDLAPVLKSETPQDQSPAFERMKPFNCDPAAMLAKGIKPAQLVGMGVNYTGNMATPDGEGAITEVIDTRGERLGSLRLVVLLEDGRRVMAERHYFTAELRPILQFNGKMHGAPYLAQLAATVATVRAQASAAKEEAAQAHAAALVDLVAQYPQLQRADNTYAGGKLAAVNMRTLLKMAFPGHKFSVTSSYNSARICWTDGPTDDEVNAIIGRFDIGASDPQSDYFYTVRTAWSDLFGGVQYLTTSRHTSDDLVSRALCELYPNSATRPAVQDYQKGTGVFDWCNHGDAMRRMMREQLAKMSAYQTPAPKTRARA